MFKMNTQATREVGPESEAQYAVMDPQNKGDHQTSICDPLLLNQLASTIHVSTVASKYNHKPFRG